MRFLEECNVDIDHYVIFLIFSLMKNLKTFIGHTYTIHSLFKVVFIDQDNFTFVYTFVDHNKKSNFPLILSLCVCLFLSLKLKLKQQKSIHWYTGFPIVISRFVYLFIIGKSENYGGALCIYEKSYSLEIKYD